MADKLEQTTSLLYAYAYNEANDVYTVRGLLEGEISYEPRAITSVPQGLLDQILFEFVANSGLNASDINPTVSFAEDGSGAIVDFYDRVFSSEQVAAIMNNGFVSKPKKPSVRSLGSFHDKRKHNKTNLTAL